MNNPRRKKAGKFTAIILILFTLVLIAAPHQLFAGVCEKALVSCAIDAGIITILGAIGGMFAGNLLGAAAGAGTAGGSYLSWCLIGYDFCKRYYAA